MIKQKTKEFPTYLTDMFADIINVPKPATSHGIIYKRVPGSKTGKFTQEELNFLADNQIPF